MQVISLEINTTVSYSAHTCSSCQFQQDLFCLLMRVCKDSFMKRLILTLNVSHMLKILIISNVGFVFLLCKCVFCVSVFVICSFGSSLIINSTNATEQMPALYISANHRHVEASLFLYVSQI